MGDGINELANVLNKQIKESGKRDVSVDFGTIEKKMWGNQKTPDFLGK